MAMTAIHQNPKQLGVAFQITSHYGIVHVRSHGDTLTNAGQLAMVAAAQTYYSGIAGAVVGPPLSSNGGAAPQQPILAVSTTGVDMLCKPGDEATVAASITTVLNTSANTTHLVPAGQLFGNVT